MIEEWRPAVGWEGIYEVSSTGRVRALDRWVQQGGLNGVQRIRIQHGRILRNSRSKGAPYWKAHFCDHDRKETWLVHVLVAKAFLEEVPGKPFVCHNDSNPVNNVVSNLRYDTAAGNFADRRGNGTHPEGTKNGNAKLSEEQVREIKCRDESCDILGMEFGVCPATIWHIRTGSTWKHLFAGANLSNLS